MLVCIGYRFEMRGIAMTKKNTIMTFLLLMLATNGARAWAECDCGCLFSSGFFDQSSLVSEDDTILRIQQAVCQDSVTTLDEAKSSLQKLDSSWNGIYGLFAESYGDTDAEHNFSQWKYHFCSESALDSANHTAFRSEIKTASPVLAQAYIACLSAPGVHLTQIGAASAKGFAVKASYVPISGMMPYAGVQHGLHNIFTYQNATCTPVNARQIGPQGLALLCSRRNANNTSTVAINTNAGSDAVSIPSQRIVLPQAPPQCQPQNVTAKTYVAATAGWVDTGIAVHAGTTLNLVADPSTTWTISNNGIFPFVGSCGWLAPTPPPTPAQQAQLPMPGAPIGALIAEIGSG
jgi:hypothetical protein